MVICVRGGRWKYDDGRVSPRTHVRTSIWGVATAVAIALSIALPCAGADRPYHALPSLDALAKPTGPNLWLESYTEVTGSVEPLNGGVPEVQMSAEPRAAETRPHLFLALGISAGVVGGMVLNSLTDGKTQPYHFATEGWFRENTYVGGGDKASHFVSFEIISLELATTFQYLGFSRWQSELGGFAVSSLTGLTNEICDGANKYGFSYEDLVMDVLGAGTAALTSATGTGDLIGFRVGLLPGPVPPADDDGFGTGRDYSHEIYTADFKLRGFARRLSLGEKAARFVLVSTTYGVEGYPYGTSDQQKRLVGFEVGVNFEEILYALDVDQQKWWGIVAHALLDNFRIPYTQLGFRYDLNHGNWYGPVVGSTTM